VLAIDAGAVEAVTALRAADVPSILLKGRSFAHWLYEPSEPRIYTDIDLLVPHQVTRKAGCVLRALGYRPRSPLWAPLREEKGFSRIERLFRAEPATVWVRATDDMNLDLHRTLIAVSSEADPWDLLSAETESMDLAGKEVTVLSQAGRALHVALHALEHGVEMHKPLIDLDRALKRVPDEAWRDAADLAARLGATEAFVGGLRTLPAGAELAARLGLTSGTHAQEVMLVDSRLYSSWAIQRVADIPGLSGKVRAVARRVFPNPGFMRVRYPAANRGPVGLGYAYLLRLAWFATASGPAVRAWWRASRKSRRGSDRSPCRTHHGLEPRESVLAQRPRSASPPHGQGESPQGQGKQERGRGEEPA
jgi:hypothetical protein